MEKIFYADKIAYPSSIEAVQKILSSVFGINSKILRTKNGKPYLPQGDLHFSVSHTKDRLFIAFSSENVGVDAEKVDRKIKYSAILKKFDKTEQSSVFSTEDFLRLWTVKESVVKYMGGSIASDLTKIAYRNGKIFYDGKELPCVITQLTFEGYILSFCGKNFQNVQFVRI